MELINDFLAQAVGYVWGLPLVIALVFSGLFFSFYLGGGGLIQFRGFRHAFAVVRGRYDNPSDPGEISHFQALCTALSATVGLGNIAGVAIAIHIGGPGATFWMILVGLVGMATKYAECSLAIMYRRVDSKGVVHGGPMHYIERGLGKKWRPLAIFFAVCCMISACGAGNMFQTNQVAAILRSSFGIPPLLTGMMLAFFTGVVIIGGIKRIGQVASKLVPGMGMLYFLASVLVVIINIDQLPGVISLIFTSAFSGTAAVGGFTGVVFRQVLIQGVRRAVFSNEAGMGSAAIAHSAAATKEPVREGVVALLEPFIDTVVICTLTAIVIIISGAWTQTANGVELTAIAFDTVLPGFGKYFVPIAVLLFAYSTLLSWSYYGERAADYIFGEKGVFPFKIVFCLLAMVGAVWSSDAVVNFSDTMFGIMAVPNLLAVWILLPKLKRATKTYFRKLDAGEFPVYKRRRRA